MLDKDSEVCRQKGRKERNNNILLIMAYKYIKL